MKNERKIWMRLGITITASPEEIEKLITGDGDTLRKAIKERMFELDGESYIPSVEVDAYNIKYAGSFPMEDTIFDM